MNGYGEKGIEGGLRAALILIMAAALCVPLLTLAGCGKAEVREGGAQPQEEYVQAQEEAAAVDGAPPGEGAAESDALDVPDSDGDAGDDGSEGTSGGGNTSFAFDAQALGSSGGYPGFDVVDVRWSDHGDFYRIVFELRGHDGAVLDRVPICETYYPDGTATPEDMRRLGIRLVGFYDLLDEELMPTHATVSTGDDVVTEITNMGIFGATDTLHFWVSMSWPHKHRLHYLADPMRIILDISKDPDDSLTALSDEVLDGLRLAMPMGLPLPELPPEY